MSEPWIILASSNPEFNQISFKIGHMCHAPKAEFAYNGKRILFSLIYCAWFQISSNKPDLR